MRQHLCMLLRCSSDVEMTGAAANAGAAAAAATAARGAATDASSFLPWVEKYRPQQLTELVSQQDIVNTINRLIAANRLPHLLFYGPPGTGKTTTILAIARKLYGSSFSSMVLEVCCQVARAPGTPHMLHQQLVKL